jgi:transcriptional regulator of met regulon
MKNKVITVTDCEFDANRQSHLLQLNSQLYAGYIISQVYVKDGFTEYVLEKEDEINCNECIFLSKDKLLNDIEQLKNSEKLLKGIVNTSSAKVLQILKEDEILRKELQDIKTLQNSSIYNLSNQKAILCKFIKENFDLNNERFYENFLDIAVRNIIKDLFVNSAISPKI